VSKPSSSLHLLLKRQAQVHTALSLNMPESNSHSTASKSSSPLRSFTRFWERLNAFSMPTPTWKLRMPTVKLRLTRDEIAQWSTRLSPSLEKTPSDAGHASVPRPHSFSDPSDLTPRLSEPASDADQGPLPRTATAEPTATTSAPIHESSRDPSAPSPHSPTLLRNISLSDLASTAQTDSTEPANTAGNGIREPPKALLASDPIPALEGLSVEDNIDTAQNDSTEPATTPSDSVTKPPKALLAPDRDFPSPAYKGLSVQDNGDSAQNNTADSTATSSEADGSGNMSLPVNESRDILAEEILRPISKQLQKLSNTTAAIMSPPGPLKGKTQLELVNERVLPIGEFIVQYLHTLEVSQKGAMDMRLW
jgi:hypothetical protein